MLLHRLFARKKTIQEQEAQGGDRETVAFPCSRRKADHGRRRLLKIIRDLARGGMLASLLGYGLGSVRARAASGGSLVYDLGELPAGQAEMVEWQGKPVWIVHRTAQMIEELKENTPDLEDPRSAHSTQPAAAHGETRSLRPEYFVCIGMCTHMGCAINPRLVSGPRSGMGEDWHGGFLCPCHGSRFDLAGRVYKGMPALVNLEVPPYAHVGDTRLIIGVAPEPR